jgi:hypothetical protein
VGKHPPAGGDMKVGVGIIEQCGRLGEPADEDSEPDDQRPGRDEPTSHTCAVSGFAHQNDHALSAPGVARISSAADPGAHVLRRPPPIDRNNPDIN